jgi:Arc/MetJ-type ribon-helix-helix transcriptional regulator
MATEISVTLDDQTVEKIEGFVQRGYFDSVQELIEVAVRQYLYELSLEDAEWPRHTGRAQQEIEDEIEDIRRVQQSEPGEDPGIQ